MQKLSAVWVWVNGKKFVYRIEICVYSEDSELKITTEIQVKDNQIHWLATAFISANHTVKIHRFPRLRKKSNLLKKQYLLRKNIK